MNETLLNNDACWRRTLVRGQVKRKLAQDDQDMILADVKQTAQCNISFGRLHLLEKYPNSSSAAVVSCRLCPLKRQIHSLHCDDLRDREKYIPTTLIQFADWNGERMAIQIVSPTETCQCAD